MGVIRAEQADRNGKKGVPNDDTGIIRTEDHGNACNDPEGSPLQSDVERASCSSTDTFADGDTSERSAQGDSRWQPA
jgi:hypothetical protein